MRKSIWLAVYLFISGSLLGQEKIIEGDTSSWDSQWQIMHQKLGLKNLIQSEDEFNFRFQNHSQIIELTKNGDEFSGVLVDHVFRSSLKSNIRKDTLYYKKAFSYQSSRKIYELIQVFEMPNLLSDEDIKEWNYSCHGINYVLEYANRTKYSYKTYWNPSIQDSLAMSEKVSKFIEELHLIANSEESRKEFENTWIKNGCYDTGNFFRHCYIINHFDIGSLSSTRFPYGFELSSNIGYLGNKEVHLKAIFSYQKSKTNGQIIKGFIGKGSLFIDREKYNDYIIYRFQERNLNFLDTPTNRSRVHSLSYGISSWSTGLSMLETDEHEFGFNLGFRRSLSPIGITFDTQFSIFKNQANFTIGGSKSFRTSRINMINSIEIQIYYEQFFDYRDVNLGFSVNL